MLFQGCGTTLIKKTDLGVAAWINNTDAMQDLCKKIPELKEFGFYRRIDLENLQFLSFCDKNSSRMIAFKDEDVEKILNSLQAGPDIFAGTSE
jgi:hypothetical protein